MVSNAVVRLTLLLLLSGCTHLDVSLVRDASSLSELPPDSGLLAVRVVDLGHGVPLDHVTFAPVDYDESSDDKPQRIRTHRVNEFGVSVFVGAVRAGRYSLYDVFGQGVAGGPPRSRQIAGDPALGTFVVEAGKLTRLGTIFYYPAPVADGHRDLFTRNDSLPGLRVLLSAEYGALLPLLKNPDSPLGWDEDNRAGSRFDTYLGMKQNPIALDRTAVFDDETVIMSRAGALLRRGSDGAWNVELLDTDAPVATFDKNSRNDAVAVSEDGKLFVQRSDTGRWQHIPNPASQEKYVAAMLEDNDVIRVFAAGKYTLAVLEGVLEGLLVGDSPEPADWSVRLIYREDLGWVDFDASDDPRVVRTYYKLSGEPKSLPYDELDRLSFANKGDALLFSVKGRAFVFDERSGGIERIKSGLRIARIGVNGEALAVTGLPPYIPIGAALALTELPIVPAVAPPPYTRRWSTELRGDWRETSTRVNRCPGERSEARSTHCADNRTRKYTHHRHAGQPYLSADGRLYSVLIPADPPAVGMGSPPKALLRALMPPVWLKDQPGYLARMAADGRNWAKVENAEDLPAGCNKVLPSTRDDELLIGCSGTSGRLYAYDIAEGSYTLVREPEAFWAR